MSDFKEFNASELSDKELEKITAGKNSYDGDPNDLVGKLVDFLFYTPGPAGGTWPWSGNSLKVTQYLGLNTDRHICGYLSSNEVVVEIEGGMAIPVSSIYNVH